MQLVGAIPVDAVAAAFAGEQRGNHVDARLDRPRLARPERNVDTKARQARDGIARLVGSQTGVADAKAHQVADTLTREYINALDGIEILVPLGLILIVLVVKPTRLFGRQTV